MAREHPEILPDDPAVPSVRLYHCCDAVHISDGNSLSYVKSMDVIRMPYKRKSRAGFYTAHDSADRAFKFSDCLTLGHSLTSHQGAKYFPRHEPGSWSVTH